MGAGEHIIIIIIIIIIIKMNTINLFCLGPSEHLPKPLFEKVDPIIKERLKGYTHRSNSEIDKLYNRFMRLYPSGFATKE